MTILSIQSHVCYGYVGNRAATYPLQSLGYDVWNVNTVQFSNHTGYQKWQGMVFPSDHIKDVLRGINELGVTPRCKAVISGYMGDPSIGKVVLQTVAEYRRLNQDLLYICDPVMGDVNRGFFVKPGLLEFFAEQALPTATIITPNHFEAEALWRKPIRNLEEARAACAFFHQKGVYIVAITSVLATSNNTSLSVLASCADGKAWLGTMPYYHFEVPPNGTGDAFSALFLGYYLQDKSIAKALKSTLTAMDLIMATTHRQGQRELAIVGHHYDTIPARLKIEVQAL